MDTTVHNFRPLSLSEAKLFSRGYHKHMQAINKAHLLWATNHMARKSLIQILIDKKLQVDTGHRVGLDIQINHRTVVLPTSILESEEVPYNVCRAVALVFDGISSRNKTGCLGTEQDFNLRLLGLLLGISILLTMNTPIQYEIPLIPLTYVSCP